MRSRILTALLAAAGALHLTACAAATTEPERDIPPPVACSSAPQACSTSFARIGLEALPVKGRAPMTGYSRSEFGQAWTDSSAAPWSHNGLSTREDILSRDLQGLVCKSKPTPRATPHCVVKAGTLADPYTGRSISFTRGATSSMAVQIDHVTALADSWQKGAQQLSREQRVAMANDPLNLFATDGRINQQKGAGDAATWLPSNKQFRCTYIARQIAVKQKYHLWVTAPEKAAMIRILSACPSQQLPSAQDALRRM
ncbi:HNH endonuclease family protein [Arthrobacter woluwensis]|uniref:HNH endonuclease family protein n=1 Tax=Arthrobacter woluwensis TaxID=156980 RepID=UPI003815AC3F